MEESLKLNIPPIEVAIIVEALLNGTEANIPEHLLQKLEENIFFKEYVLNAYFVAKEEKKQQQLQKQTMIADGRLNALLLRVIQLENYSYQLSLQTLHRSTKAQKNALKAQEKAWHIHKTMVLQSIFALSNSENNTVLQTVKQVQKRIQSWQRITSRKLANICTSCDTEQKMKKKLAQFVQLVPTFQDLEQWTNRLEHYMHTFKDQLDILENLHLDVLEVKTHLNDRSLGLKDSVSENVNALLNEMQEDLIKLHHSIEERQNYVLSLQEKTVLSVKVIKLKVEHYTEEVLKKTA